MTTSAAGDGHIVEGGEGEDMLVSSSTDATGFLARWKNFFIGPQDETFSSDEAESLLPQTALTNGYDSVGTNVRNQGRYCRPRRSMSSLITTQESAWDDFKSNKWTSKMIIQKCLYEPIGFLPAVVLGLLLNLLDAISYGLIIFPLNTAPFQSLGPDGISMFFVSCIISQLVFSLGGSAFKGGNGGMMIEVVPFLHLMAETIVGRLGAENKDEVIATTILAYALSAIMTGAAFMSLGYFKLGSLIAFFPRHILVGCIGGVGWFLVITGLEVTSRMTSELTYSYETFRFLFLNHHVFSLWFTPLSLALVLRLLQRKIKHPFLIPTFFMAVPMLFYLIVAIAGFDWDMLRENGWVFPMPSGNAPGWQFYTFFDLGKTNWSAILETVPVMLALTFFGILHVPINVPALAVSTGQDNVDINRELVAHGYSNLLSGCFGTLQNYLVYTNSVLFIKSGGNSRVAGIMLAVATLIVFLIGPWIVGYIPVMVVGALIFHLGMDLVKEALLDTWGLVHRFEYLTIILIVVFMAALGFVEGIFVGILLACVFFVVKNSRKECIRYSCTGESAKSTVRRVYRQQKFLRQVGRQIYIFKLQGDMFFGTINKVEMAIRDVFSRRRWESNPIQFLVLDFALVRDIDFSAAEGFGRIRRTVRAKGVCLVLSGLDEEMSRTLQMVGVWGAGSGNGMSEGHGHGQPIQESFDTQVFPGLSEALEYCENCLLQTFYRAKASAIETARRQRQLEETAAQEEDGDSETSRFFSEQIPNSPRKSFLFNVARDTLLAHDRPIPQPMNLQEPVPTLLAAFSDTRENPIDFFLQLSMYFTRKTVLAGTILWRQGGLPVDGLYIIETGTMRSIQEFQDSGVIRRTAEVALPGTIAGEIGLFTGQVRTSTLVSETDGVVWGLSQDQFQKMVKDDPSLAVEFMRIAMSYSAERLNLMSQYAFSLS
ncbi:sulfate transporter family-domain-containing protein [Lobosporangium transversale]|uniref:Sulfate transporter family-domain-containing protein n=1 Tax=Lobosporangium transversale TaxID=64571 RepID=A0A1Y2GJD1_9FUNG|nr:sulfate transporter family-domain-containing protein [Lobosporangium transversale]ORZ12552.1 sulfate transporter family-domain-containing protein [Lobosporangium transversale]|eukprot:XP_021880171.1 sulfate transporter family-domain-containing protein [Lobosporangium transversale]